jgi:hypothetical protein
MKKHLILWSIVSLLPAFCLAKTLVRLRGTVQDADRHTPLAYVSIYMYNKVDHFLASAVSDVDGRFQISLPGKYATDTLHFSLVGFHALALPVAGLIHQQALTILLKESVTILPPVTVRGMTARELIGRCLENIDDNYKDVSFIHRSSFWQSVRDNQVYQNLRRGTLRLEEKLQNGNVERKIIVDSVVNYRSTPRILFADTIENIFYVDFVRAGSAIANEENNREWSFAYDRDRAVPEDYSWINASRNDHLAALNILVNEHDYAIERIDYAYDWKKTTYHDVNDTLAYAMRRLSGKVLYHKMTTKYTVQYVFLSATCELFRKHGYKAYKKTVEREITSELAVTSCREHKGLIPETFPNEAGNSEALPVINTEKYCEAARALGIPLLSCNPDPVR